MEFIQNYVPTSKAQLIQVAMMYNNGNTQKAQEMFDFYAKNLELPDFDPIAPSFMQQVKTSASDLFSWIKENQGDIVNGYQFIRSALQKAPEPPLAPEDPLPPING